MKFKKITLYFTSFMLIVFLQVGLNPVEKNKIEIKDRWLYVNGEKFFIKGICYFEAHEVDGQYVQNSPEILDYEFKKIKEAGFNTIRTYLTPEKIKIAKKYGLFIFQDADRLCFSNEYKDQTKIKILKKNIDEIVGFSKDYDNILFYGIDNEPNINAIYKQGEQNAGDMWKMLAAKVKEVQPDALVSIAMMPPNGFADVSMCDIISLNLYPMDAFHNNSIGYANYADWYKRSHAQGKPFILSEYGWTEDLKDFSSVILKELDMQIKIGACGSFLTYWRSWGKEKDKDYYWWGLIPNNGLANDYKNKPRQIYYDFQKYFEAVAVEPKVNGIYTKIIPLEIYGTDKTALAEAIFKDKKVELKKNGKYWWNGEISVDPASYGENKIEIITKNKFGQILVKKEINIFLCAEKKSLTVKIQRDQKKLIGGKTYEAKIIVVNEKGEKVPNQPLILGINQSTVASWYSIPIKAATDSNGEYLFKEDFLFKGYFHLLANVDTARKDIETFADVDVSRVDTNPDNNPNAPGYSINLNDFPAGWRNITDNGSKIKLSTFKYDSQNVMEISYNFGKGNWFVLIQDKFQDLRKYQGIRFTYRESNSIDKIEFKIEDKDGSIFTASKKDSSSKNEWKTVVVFFDELEWAWQGDKHLDFSNAVISFAVSKTGIDENTGKLNIGKLEFIK